MLFKIKFMLILLILVMLNQKTYNIPVNNYRGSFSLDLQPSDPTSVDVSFSLVPDTQCKLTFCYYGWIDIYQILGQQPFQGINNEKLTARPIFYFEASPQNYAFKLPSQLDKSFKELILASVQRLNPFAKTRSQTYNLAVNNAEFTKSRVTQSVAFDKENNFQSRSDLYQFALLTQKGQAQIDKEQVDIQDFQGKLEARIQFLGAGKQIPDDQFLKYKEELLRQYIVETRDSIEKARSNPGIDQFSQTDKEQKNDPKIILDQINTIVGRQSKIDVNLYFRNPQSYSVQRGNVKLAQTDVSPAATVAGTRNLQTPITITLLSYSKLLYSRTILGKLTQVKFFAKCTLTLGSPHQVSCSGILTYTIFGNTQSLTIYSFTKSVSTAWVYNNSFGGNWSFNFWVPLPPPVSFITIHFYIQVHYYININIEAKTIAYWYPYRYRVRAVVQTGIDTNARASIRLLVVEGGVYIQGTLVKVATDPTATLSYYFFQKKINILIEWYFWIIAFNFEWGFFWRYWTFWSGWSSVKIITKWTINGIYQKYTIVNTSWNIYL